MSQTPTVLNYCFDLIDPLITAKTVNYYEVFLMGYTAGKYGASALQKSLELYEYIASLRDKKKVNNKELADVYMQIFSGNKSAAEETLKNLKTHLPAIEEEKSSSLKKFSEQFDSVVSRLKLDTGKEIDKASLVLVKKLTEEEQKESEKRRKMKEEMDKTVCKLCQDPIDSQELYVMESCDDVFHAECIESYMVKNINEKQIPIPCPLCKNELLYNDFRSLLTEADLQKYDNLSFKKQLDSNPEGYSFCPTPNCAYIFFWEKDDSNDFQCPLCKKRYCLRCRCEFHAGKTCYQYMRDLHNQSDKKFLEFASGMKLKRCPSCHYWVEKISGDDFMRCKCGNTFCYRCGSKVGFCSCRNYPYQPVAYPQGWANRKPNKRRGKKKKNSQPYYEYEQMLFNPY